MKTLQSLQRHRLLTAVLAAGLAGFAGANYAADAHAYGPAIKADTPAASGAKTNAATLAPSKSDSADTAFRKLDATGKGYVSRDDVKALPGFEKVFEKFDTKHDGKLTREDFAKAWDAYKAPT